MIEEAPPHWVQRKEEIYIMFTEDILKSQKWGTRSKTLKIGAYTVYGNNWDAPRSS